MDGSFVLNCDYHDYPDQLIIPHHLIMKIKDGVSTSLKVQLALAHRVRLVSPIAIIHFDGIVQDRMIERGVNDR